MSSPDEIVCDSCLLTRRESELLAETKTNPNRVSDQHLRKIVARYELRSMEQMLQMVRDAIAADRALRPSPWADCSDGQNLPPANTPVLAFRPNAHLGPAYDPNVRIISMVEGKWEGIHVVTKWMHVPLAN